MSGSFIAFSELQAMSGYTQPAAVERWLRENGLPYVKNRDGQPVTTRGALDEALLLQVKPGIGGLEKWSPPDEPNFGTH